MNSIVHNTDCLEGMKQYPDKHFELAIVDPPYGLERMARKGDDKHNRISLKKAESFNNNKPGAEFWEELFRVSKNQIVWGANNFQMPPSEYFCIWNKQQTVDNFASAEYAWVSMGLKKPAKVFDYSIHLHNHTDKIHPTQKPVQLYKWLLKNYAKEGDKILDTHLGSGSSRIAAYEMGFDFTGYELDTEYYLAQEKRFSQHISQLKLFSPNQEAA